LEKKFPAPKPQNSPPRKRRGGSFSIQERTINSNDAIEAMRLDTYKIRMNREEESRLSPNQQSAKREDALLSV